MDTVYDDFSDFNFNLNDIMTAAQGANGGSWIWPGRGAFRIPTQDRTALLTEIAWTFMKAVPSISTGKAALRSLLRC
jgi:hypothetical protein